MKRALVLTWVLGLAASAGAAAQTRAPASRDGTVVIRAGSAAVRVVGWSRGEVEVSGHEPENGKEVRVVPGDGETRVRIRTSEDVVVRVPAASRVEVLTQSGDVRVEGVTGALGLESMSGSFWVAGSPRMVTVEGISGDFRLLGATETLRVKTVSGNVIVPRARGFLELHTTSGNVEVTSRGLRRGTFRNTSGRTEFTGTVPRDGSLHFETSSGQIELLVPAGIAADFELTSLGNGEIESELGPRPQRSGRAGPVEVLRFANGSGGAEITARTVSGTIRLRRQ